MNNQMLEPGVMQSTKPESVKAPGNTTNCRACKEAMETIQRKIRSKENLIIVISFESGVTHYASPVSKVEFEKLNYKFQLLK